jgi:hypothetical protein
MGNELAEEVVGLDILLGDLGFEVFAGLLGLGGEWGRNSVSVLHYK